MAEHAEDTRVKDALELLNSYAKDKRDELQDMMTRKYSNLRSVMDDMRGDASQMFQSGREKVKQTAQDIDKSVHDHPWQYIGGVALGALIVGYLLGRSQK